LCQPRRRASQAEGGRLEEPLDVPGMVETNRALREHRMSALTVPAAPTQSRLRQAQKGRGRVQPKAPKRATVHSTRTILGRSSSARTANQCLALQTARRSYVVPPGSSWVQKSTSTASVGVARVHAGRRCDERARHDAQVTAIEALRREVAELSSQHAAHVLDEQLVELRRRLERRRLARLLSGVLLTFKVRRAGVPLRDLRVAFRVFANRKAHQTWRRLFRRRVLPRQPGRRSGRTTTGPALLPLRAPGGKGAVTPLLRQTIPRAAPRRGQGTPQSAGALLPSRVS
jgi:hypothetical protein